MNDIYQEVDFEKYCATCEYKDLEERLDPCNGCLDYGYNTESSKPVNWKELDDCRR